MRVSDRRLGRMRRRAHEGFDARITFVAPVPAASRTLNPTTLDLDDPPPTVLYAGPANVRASLTSTELYEAGRATAPQRVDVDVPAHVLIPRGAIGTVTSARDSGLVGTQYRVVQPDTTTVPRVMARLECERIVD